MAGVELASFAGGIGRGLSSALNQYMRYKLAQQLAQQEMQLRQQLAEKQSQLQYENQKQLFIDRAMSDYEVRKRIHEEALKGNPVAQEIEEELRRKGELQEEELRLRREWLELQKQFAQPSRRGGRTARRQASPEQFLSGFLAELHAININPQLSDEQKADLIDKTIRSARLQADILGFSDVIPLIDRYAGEYLGYETPSLYTQEDIYQRPGLSNLFARQPIPRAGLGLFPGTELSQSESPIKLGAIPFTGEVGKGWIGLTPEEQKKNRLKIIKEREKQIPSFLGEVAESPYLW